MTDDESPRPNDRPPWWVGSALVAALVAVPATLLTMWLLGALR